MSMSSGTPMLVSNKGCLRREGWTMYNKREEVSPRVSCRKCKEGELEDREALVRTPRKVTMRMGVDTYIKTSEGK